MIRIELSDHEGRDLAGLIRDRQQQAGDRHGELGALALRLASQRDRRGVDLDVAQVRLAIELIDARVARFDVAALEGLGAGDWSRRTRLLHAHTLLAAALARRREAA